MCRRKQAAVEGMGWDWVCVTQRGCRGRSRSGNVGGFGVWVRV